MSKIYAVLRYHSEKEWKHSDPKDRYVLYGWTKDKKILDAFFSQRSKNKYVVKKFDQEEIKFEYTDEFYPEDMIDYIELPLASTGEKYPLFITKHELIQAETMIIRMMTDAARLVERADGKTNLLELYHNLDNDYKDALEFLGFVPPELEAIFDSVKNQEDEISELIETCFETYPQEMYARIDKPYGIDMMPNVWQQVIFSLEAFIKVLREEM